MRQTKLNHKGRGPGLTAGTVVAAPHGTYYVDDEGDLWIRIGDFLHFWTSEAISIGKDIRDVAENHQIRHAEKVEITYS